MAWLSTSRIRQYLFQFYWTQIYGMGVTITNRGCVWLQDFAFFIFKGIWLDQLGRKFKQTKMRLMCMEKGNVHERTRLLRWIYGSGLLIAIVGEQSHRHIFYKSSRRMLWEKYAVKIPNFRKLLLGGSNNARVVNWWWKLSGFLVYDCSLSLSKTCVIPCNWGCL